MDYFIYYYVFPSAAILSSLLIYLAIKGETIARLQQERIRNEDVQFDGLKRSMLDIEKVLYSKNTVYGGRSSHFHHEKLGLIDTSLDQLELKLTKCPTTQFCLLIDSGTSMYQVFVRLTDRLKRRGIFYENRDRICIVTNNITGVLLLMKYAKYNPEDDYSDIMVECISVPGKPLSVYAAFTGKETVSWLENIREVLANREWRNPQYDLKIIGFVTGNYICKSVKNKIPFSPVARGEGHVAFKETVAKISDEIFIISPLMKFSFASTDQFNDILGFTVDQNTKDARLSPREVKCMEVEIPKNKKCVFFTTTRGNERIFYQFSQDIHRELNTFAINHSGIFEVHSYGFNPTVDPYYRESIAKPEVELEIPHKNLRMSYFAKQNIWSKQN